MTTVPNIPVTPKVTEITAGPAVVGTSRLNSVDLLRGLIMVIMALDHTRDFFTHLRFQPEDIRFTWGMLFFTRWITHFCAPVFFFLAGTGAFLSKKSGAELSNFLWKRGLWLILLEFTLYLFAWTFNFAPFVVLLVIWALGACMVAMSVLVRLPLKWMATISVAMILVHNAFDSVGPAVFGKLGWLWLVLHRQGFIPMGQNAGAFVAYPLIPWIGVMGAGYAFGTILKMPAEKRRKTLYTLGAAMTLAFIVLRATNIYGHQPDPLAKPSEAYFHVQPTAEMTVIDFLDTQKYPPSLQYLLMTLGPSIILLAWFESVDLRRGIGRFWDKILVYGRVPMFYYTLHLFLIHIMAIISAVAFGQPVKWLWHGAFFSNQTPPGYGHNLPYIYAMWIAAVVILYFPCMWFAGVKARRKDWWLSYL
jgi:uncharacterized membrane protein